MNNDKNLPELEIEPVDDAGGSISHSGASGSAPNTSQKRAKVQEEDPLIGVMLKGTYRLVKKVGEGGMGNVYKALQFPLQREVAVKILKPTESNPEGEHYFMREVQAINMLRHPNIIGILDFGKEPDGTLYLVMEYLPGRTLKRVIKRDYPLDPVRMCNICIQILSALEQAHQTGIVRCDLKPANIMLEEIAGDPDFVKVLDFGIAKVKGPAMEVGPYTQAGNIVGTFDYMSPEQIMRRDLDGRADIWSLGVIMYEMLTRKRIFHDRDAVSIIGRVMQMPIKRPSEILDPDSNYRIPKAVEDVIMRAMDRNVESRFQTAGEMRDELKRVVVRIEGGGADPDRTIPPSNDNSDVHSGMTGGFGSALSRDASGNLVPSKSISADTSRTGGLSSIYTRSGGFGMGDSQRLATGVAAGTSVLDQTFSIQELQDTLLGERRKVAVLAIQQRARRGKGIDPEELARRSASEVAIIRAAVEHFEGEIDSFLGGTYTIMFGASKSRMGDNVRAIECALALRNEFLKLEQGADHIGIAVGYGEVYLSSKKGGNAFGETIDRTVEIARGAQHADVYADEGLADVTREQVEFEGRRNVGGELVAKVLHVKRDSSKAGTEVNTSEIYVPRPGYFSELMRRASDAKQGEGGGLAILGDVGSGKSTLLKHFVADLSSSGWQVFQVRTQDLGGTQGLAVLRSWIRSIAMTYKDPATLIRKACETIGLDQGIDAVVALYMSAHPDARMVGQLPWQDSKSFGYFTAALLQRMIRFAMKQGPVLLVVDELNPTDSLELDILDNIIASVQKAPVLVAAVMTHRSIGQDHGLPGNLEVLPIGGFTEGEARQCMQMTLGYTPPAEVTHHLFSRSNGNPTFLVEMLRSLGRDDQTQMLTAASLERLIPHSLEEMLSARVDEVGDAFRDVLAIASVLGESFREELLYQIAPAHLGPKLAVGELVRRRMIEATSDSFGRITLAFSPRALRQVVYGRLPKESRYQFHSRVIEFLEQAAQVAAVDPIEWPMMLAFHYRAVDGWEGAAHYMMKAGDILLDLYDYPSAISQYQAARTLLDENGFTVINETYAAVLARLLIVLRESGRIDDALSVLEKLPSLDQVPLVYRAPLLLERGRVGMDSSDLDGAFKALDAVRDIAVTTENPKLEVQALLAMGQIFEKQNQLSNAANIIMEVSNKVAEITDINLQDPEDRKLYWTAYNQLGTLFIRQHDFQRAQQFLNQALARAQEIQDQRGMIRVLSNMGALCLSMRDTQNAREYFGTALQFARGTGDLLNQSRIMTNIAIAAMEANDFESAKKYFKQARDVAEDIGWHEGLADLSLHIQRLRAALG